jgi:hypothetical protein
VRDFMGVPCGSAEKTEIKMARTTCCFTEGCKAVCLGTVLESLDAILQHFEYSNFVK